MPETASSGGVVAAVEPKTAAEALLRPGDVVLSVDGQRLRDVIDWWWYTDEPVFTLEILRSGEHLELAVQRHPGQALGIRFTESVFDGIRECDNACAFCFVSALPKGLRPALYVRDDDFRLSFLSGNFITLTNVDDADIDRIIGQHLSPLYVSVHAVDPVVRRRLICPTAEDRALEALDSLLEGGIGTHVQIVLVPGINDAEVLDETLAYLAARDGILSVGCVPMGYTEHQRRWHSSFDTAGARAVLERIDVWQRLMRARSGVGWVYAADELHLLGGVPVPPAEAYDGFPQYENGIGMTRLFMEELRTAAASRSSPATLVTGELFAPVLRETLSENGWRDVRVLPVSNRLFGGNVSVTGLLGGRDIAHAIAHDAGLGTYYVPDLVLNCDGLLLDDVRGVELAALAGADVRFVGSDAGSLVRALVSGEAASR
ncbi:MAG: DUF512 domain-containing protein [Coriobacteriia bacterium]